MSRPLLTSFLFALVVFLSCLCAQAADETAIWLGGSGDWTDPMRRRRWIIGSQNDRNGGCLIEADVRRLRPAPATPTGR